MSDSLDGDASGVGRDGTIVTVVAETTGHMTFEVPAEDVREYGVSLENAELVDEAVHGDPMAYVRKDTNEEVEILED